MQWTIPLSEPLRELVDLRSKQQRVVSEMYLSKYYSTSMF